VLARRLGITPWAGVSVALSPGLLYAVTADTSEPLGVALLGLALLSYLDRRWVWTGICLTALCLTKEVFVLIPITLIGWSLWRRRDRDMGAALAALAAAPVVFGLWQLYLFVRFDEWALLSSPEIITTPLKGWWDAIAIASGFGVGGVETAQLGQAALPLIVAVGAALIFGIVRASRMRFFLDPIYLGLALLTFCLSPLGVLYPKDLFRLTATLFLLLPAILLGPRDEGIDTEVAEAGA
ncbi:MAG: hypothetical protein M3238_08710, partial [Actinomycetota bacterium]|nr:hypothetical protein [Actinomycetota bacterium]